MVDNNMNDLYMMLISNGEGDLIAENYTNMQRLSVKNRNEVELIASSIRGKLHQQPPLPASSCIFRIPIVLRRHNKKVFVPNLVSIGPFHHGKSNLLVMEETKLWYLRCLLDRKPTLETRLEYFVEIIRRMEQHCRNCYSEKIDMSSEKFVEMMVLDGCFIVELFRKYAKLVPSNKDDPVFYTSWMHSVLINDLFLLENQIPWKVLDSLFHHTRENNDRPASYTLFQLALNFFRNSTLKQSSELNGEVESKHLLDVIRNSLLGSYSQLQLAFKSYWEPIPSVTELLQAGVQFKLRNGGDNMLDITFENGVMEIPPLHILENGESLFRNLIAYEQCSPSISISNITSFAVVLDNLINSSKDVDFLIQKGIVTTVLSKEDIACFFNRLYNDTIPGYFSYAELTKNVNAYYKDRWHRWQTILRRDYFNNPWSTLSFAAALLILGLTFIQTIYTIMPYYQNSM